MKKAIMKKMVAINGNGSVRTNGSTSYSSVIQVVKEEMMDIESPITLSYSSIVPSPMSRRYFIFNYLPDEVLIEVLRLLNFTERTSCERLSKRLNNLLRRVWLNQSSFAVKFGCQADYASGISDENHLDFVSFDQLINILVKIPNISKVSFVGMPPEIIKFLAENCKSIQDIYTDNLNLVNIYVEGAGICNQISKITVSDFGERIPSVNNLDFLLKCPKLKELNLGQFSNINIPVGVIQRLDKITTTESNCGNSSVEIISNGRRLKTLKCYHSLTDAEIRLVSTTMPMITEISAAMDARDFMALIPLKHLSSVSVQLIQGTRSSKEVTTFLSANGRQLKRLDIIQCPTKGRDADYYYNIPTLAPNLKTLTVDTPLHSVSHISLYRSMARLNKITLQETGIENFNLLNLILSTSRKIKRVTFKYMKDEGHHTSNYSAMPSQDIIDLLNEYGLNRRKGFCLVEIDGKPWNDKYPDKTLDFIFST